jgi:Zn-dependent M28 family amino/carboxypeptidase
MKRSVAEKLFRFAGRDLHKIQAEVDESLSPQSFELKGIEASLDVQVERAQVRTRNVVGFLEGSDPKLREEVLIIGGHFDHVGYGHYGSRQGHRGKIHNGADDNASGTSAILELAEAFSRLETAPRRSILFLLFSGEERGLLGSKYYVDHPLIPLKKTVAMINLDMVGRGKGDAFTVFGTGTSPSFESLLKGINARTEHDIKYRPEGTGPSDHSSFYHKGVPVLFFHTGLHPDYHTPADDWNKINAHGCEVVTRFIYLTAYYLAVVSDERPGFSKSESPRKKRVMLGVRPGDSVEKDEGFRVGEIVKGSAAEKAGLRKGDLIFRIGSAKIRNFEDLASAIGKLKIGQKVPVEIQRAGERKVISVTLGSSK